MDLSSDVKLFLQTNYYISDEDLALPFDKMPSYLKDLISTSAMKQTAEGELVEKSEEELLEAVNDQFLSDIDSDINSSREAQLENFFKNEKTLYDLSDMADKQNKNPSDIDRVSSLLTAKRMASEEYAQTPKTLENFLNVQKEVKKELEVKYYTTRYFDSLAQKGETRSTEENVKNIALISRMVEDGQLKKIAGALNLPQTKEAQGNAMGATLSFAMAEVSVFTKQVEEKYKSSLFAKKVSDLDSTFKKKHPKSYMAAKIAGGMALSMTLGPVYSAYKAATGLNAMRKDFAKYKEENPTEKKSFWGFIKTPENRQKMMDVGKNTLRAIPGMKALNVALSAIKNSDKLRSNIQELRKDSSNKGLWKKVALSTVGLMAVSATAAFANDEVADSLNDFISTSFDDVEAGVQDAIEQIHEPMESILGDNAPKLFEPESVAGYSEFEMSSIGGETNISARIQDVELGEDVTLEKASFDTYSDTSEARVSVGDDTTISMHSGPESKIMTYETDDETHTVEIDKDGDVNLSGRMTQDVDPTKDGMTVSSVEYDTERDALSTTITDNKTGDEIYVGTKDTGDELSFKSGDANQSFRVTNSENAGVNVSAEVRDIKISEDVTIDSAGFDTQTDYGHVKVGLGDDETVSVTSGSGSHTVGYETDNMKHTLNMGSNGDVKLSGRITQDVDPTKEGMTVSSVEYDTENEAVSTTITANKSGDEVYLGTKDTGEELSFKTKDGGQSYRMTNSENAGVNVSAEVRDIKISEDVTIDSAGFDTQTDYGHVNVGLGDDETVSVTSGSGSHTVGYETDDMKHTLNMGNNGDVKLSGRITQDVDPTKEGMTVSSVEYDTENEAVSTTITANKSGDEVYLGTKDTGEEISFKSKDGNHSYRMTNSENAGVNLSGELRDIKISKDVTIDSAGFDSQSDHSHVSVGLGDDKTVSVASGSGSHSTSYETDDMKHTLDVANNGGVKLSGRITQDVDPTKNGVTVSNVDYDTENEAVSTTITGNKSGNEVYLGTKDTGEEVSFKSKDGNHSYRVTNSENAGVNISGEVRDIKISKDVTIDNVGFDSNSEHTGVSVGLGDDKTVSARSDTTSQAVSYETDNSTHTIEKSHDGKIGLHGRIRNSVDPTKSGTTVSEIEYDTADKEVEVKFEGNKSGRSVSVRADDDELKISSQGKKGKRFNLKLGKDGVSVEGASGKSFNISKAAKILKGFMR